VFLEERENVGWFFIMDVVLGRSARYRVSSIDFSFCQVFLIPLNIPFKFEMFVTVSCSGNKNRGTRPALIDFIGRNE